MAGVLQHLRSSTLNKRPNPASMVDGQLAINYASGSPGAFFKDSNGNLVKVGPVHVGATAPNVSPASGGTAGNSLGEQWLDTSGGTYVFKIWDGSAWRSEAGEFVNTTGDTMTGALGVITGSASSPSVFFSGDANTGLYSPGADQVAISTNGTQRINIEADGDINIDSGGVFYDAANNRLAVGTTSPADKFHVDGNIRTTWGDNRVATVFDNSFRQGMAFDTTNRQLRVFSTTSDSGGSIGFYTRNGAGASDTDYGTERARIDSSGRLLVGTSSARSGFYGDATILPAFQLEGASGSYNDSKRFFAHTYNSATAYGPGFYLTKTRSSSLGGFTVVNSGDELGSIVFSGADGTTTIPSAAISAYVDGSPGTDDMPGRLVFSVTRDGSASPTEAMRINNQGVVQITAVDTNSASLVISANASSGSQYGILVASANDQNGTATYFYRAVGGPTERFTVRTNGGIANYQANDVNLSDRNAKKDISPADGTWDCIKEWEIVNYRYKDQPADADLNLGVIAQQVAESCPEVITVFEEAKDDQPEKLGVKEQQMYWMAIKALQEAQVRIEQLEAAVATLQGN
jgi:hypothetical protein